MYTNREMHILFRSDETIVNTYFAVTLFTYLFAFLFYFLYKVYSNILRIVYQTEKPVSHQALCNDTLRGSKQKKKKIIIIILGLFIF
jgi:hypothetical protein